MAYTKEIFATRAKALRLAGRMNDQRHSDALHICIADKGSWRGTERQAELVEDHNQSHKRRLYGDAAVACIRGEEPSLEKAIRVGYGIRVRKLDVAMYEAVGEVYVQDTVYGEFMAEGLGGWASRFVAVMTVDTTPQ
ncbi:hypothetical protein C8035_v006122 [Colletotrichum spinosum]|uniref:Uncharacterized protein n=1 Tax=Colletotrichum spinosum TaxID=1347390 RepID=A0A4R8Q4C9_9PEZI|nr:hypothetical protein C8035_v006122 [Colletotrichum spinosum]